MAENSLPFHPAPLLAGDTGAPLAPAAPVTALRYPETRTVAQVDTYHGVDVVDPYRWLEDDTSAETARWVGPDWNRVTGVSGLSVSLSGNAHRRPPSS